MKLFNFGQKEPVAFVGSGVLLCETQIRFSLSELEKQVNKLHEKEIIPTALSVRNLTLFDVLFYHKYISKEQNSLVFTQRNGHRNYQTVYNRNGLFQCFHLTLRAPVRLYEPIKEQPQVSCVNYEWTIDTKGNRLLKIDYLKTSGMVRKHYLLSREFISWRGYEVVRRKLSFKDSVIEKIETEVYQSDGTWQQTTEKKFPVYHWKQITRFCFDDPQEKEFS